MTTPSGPSLTYALTVDAVKQAIADMRPRSIHETFPAYLHLRKRANGLGRFVDLQPDWYGDAAEWMEVAGGPANKPYFRPFTSRGSSVDGFWLNPNLPGSYAPSSFRGLKDLYIGGDHLYRLPTSGSGQPDPNPISTRILAGKKVPAWALSAFLLRNRAFVLTSSPPSGIENPEPGWAEVLKVFQNTFGWTDMERKVLFDWSLPESDCLEGLVVSDE